MSCAVVYDSFAPVTNRTAPRLHQLKAAIRKRNADPFADKPNDIPTAEVRGLG